MIPKYGVHDVGRDYTADDISGAAELGSIHDVRQLFPRLPPEQKDVFSRNEYLVLRTVAKNTHLEILQWMFSDPDGPRLGIDAFRVRDNEVIRWAARNSDINMLKWLVSAEDGPRLNSDDFRYNGPDGALPPFALPSVVRSSADYPGSALSSAAWRGHLSTVKWMFSGEDGPRLTKEDFQAQDNAFLRGCAIHNRTPIMRWAFSGEDGPHLGADDFRAAHNYALWRAAYHDHLKVFKFLTQEVGLTPLDATQALQHRHRHITVELNQTMHMLYMHAAKH